MANLKTYDDKELMAMIADDDRSAFKELHLRYYRILLGTSFTMLKDLESAKDVTQEVFFQIWKNRKSLNIRHEIHSYLKRSVINRAINQINYQKRKGNNTQLDMMHSNNPTPLQFLETAEFQSVVDRALDELPDKCRLIFTMKRLEKMRVKEIAQELKISTKTVENQLTKALKILKEKVTPHLKDHGVHRGIK